MHLTTDCPSEPIGVRCSKEGCANPAVPPGLWRTALCFDHWCEHENYIPTRIVERNGLPHVIAGHYLREGERRGNTNSDPTPPDQHVRGPESRNRYGDTCSDFVLPLKGKRGRPAYRLGDRCPRGHVIEGATAMPTPSGGWRCRSCFNASRRSTRRAPR